jgi:hypothetical protein
LSFGLSMAHVKSNAWPIDGAATGGSSGRGEGSEERTISARSSNAGLHTARVTMLESKFPLTELLLWTLDYDYESNPWDDR